eukprot:COSAG02_NODE_64411_length_260_cov_1.273292_1_plen_50_part_10
MTAKRNELGQSNRKAQSAGRKKLSSHARLEQVAKDFVRTDKTEAHKIVQL